jgi:rfaE bifunctional protein kinase chain/domain
VILVVGDAMRDVYWHGEVTRISPEAPVPIISIKRTEEREGAAANVARNVRAMGVECREEFGAHENTVTKIRLVAKGQQTMRVDFDYPQNPITSLNFEGVRIVIFVDYGKGALTNVRDLIREAKDEGCTVLVDPKGYDYSRYSGADVVKPNLDEMKVMVGGWRDEEDLRWRVQEILTKAEIGALLLTRASDGMTLYRNSSSKHIPAVAEKIVDVTGAGETAIAALGVGLHRGSSLEESCVLANQAAGIAVGKFGPSIVSKEELEASSLSRHV